jgi:lysophospholipase L1-like esterase
MFKRMNDRVEQFTSAGTKVVLLLEPPAYHAGSPDATDAHYEQMNALLKSVAAEHPRDVATVNLEARVCPSGPTCPYIVDGLGSDGNLSHAVRPDGVHYLHTGALWVAKWLVPQIVAAAKGLS